MTQIQLAVQLDQLVEGRSTVFMKLENEIVDFPRKDISIKLHLSSDSIEDLIVELNQDNFYEVITLLKAAIFENKISVIGWNLKPLMAYIYFRTSSVVEFEKQLFDLK